MLLRTSLIACVLVLSAGSCREAAAQFGSTGTSGLSGTGSSGLSGTGSSGLGSATTTGSTSGTSATSSTGSTGTRSTGTTGAAGTTGASATGATAAQSFIGGNATQTFVGGGLQGTQQNMNRQFQAIQSTQSQFGSQGQTTGTPRSIRTTMSIGFSFPTATMAQTSGRISGANEVSLSRYTVSYPELSGITVVMNSQGIAVLTGSTASTQSKRLAANLMRLQPGVRKVDNQVAVNQ